MQNIIFKIECDFGKLAGTGHLFRILKLSSIIKQSYKNKFNYYFLLNNHKSSLDIAKKYINKNKILVIEKDYKNLHFIKENDLIINDTPRTIPKTFISFCEKKKIKDIILIDHDLIKYKYNFFLINGIFSLKKKIKKNKNIFQGIKYLILDKKYSQIKYHNNKEFNIMITTGGTDNKNIVYKIYKILKDLENIFMLIVIGPGFKKNNPVQKISDNRVMLIKNEKNLYPYFQRADLTITGGGISMFESLASKKITLVSELFKNQEVSIKELNKLNLIKIIGRNTKINKKKLITLIRKYQKLKEIKKLKKNSKINFIDGKGAFRIEKIVKKIINSKIYS